jgi:hypothetical protein
MQIRWYLHDYIKYCTGCDQWSAKNDVKNNILLKASRECYMNNCGHQAKFSKINKFHESGYQNIAINFQKHINL